MIYRSLAEGSAAGFISGLGAATAGEFYGSVAGFRLTLVSALRLDRQALIRPAGGAFLCYLGNCILTSQSSGEAARCVKVI